jgi:hypothetical protein
MAHSRREDKETELMELIPAAPGHSAVILTFIHSEETKKSKICWHKRVREEE